MITTTTFAKHYTSTWRLLTPAMDLLVRRLRLQYQREFAPLSSEVVPNRRAFINQLSFIYFSMGRAVDAGSLGMEEAALSVAIDRARTDIARIDRVPLERIAPPTDTELADCGEQVWRLKLFFSRFRRFGAIEFFPSFPGCGFIDASIGDIFVHEHLFEIKAGDRRFLSVDLKQLITYAALNSLERTREIKYLGLFNPRVGISYTVPLEQLCQEISGTSASELLGEIVRVISSGDISR